LAQCVHLFLQGFGRFGMYNVVNDDPGPLPGEFQHDSKTDAAVTTGDNGNFIFKDHVLLLIDLLTELQTRARGAAGTSSAGRRVTSQANTASAIAAAVAAP